MTLGFTFYTLLFSMTNIKEAYSELVEVLRQNNHERAKRLITETPALLTYRDDSGRLPVHWAATGGCLPFVELVRSTNPEMMSATDDSGWTPLMIASSAGRFDVCRYLLSAIPDYDIDHQ